MLPRIVGVLLVVLFCPAIAPGQWVTRDARWQPRGPWNWAVPRELPDLYREFNGIDFGHAHLAETLLKTQDAALVEKARLEVLDFIFSGPEVPPDEDIISPEFTRLAWEVRRTFNWAHTFHRSLYDLFASDEVSDKKAVYQRLLADYLEKPEAITSTALDHHGKLWAFPESKAFRDRFREFNSQIWAYHWLQAAAYDVQLQGSAALQRELMAPVIEHYHGYLRKPPVEWEMMPMMREAAPEFSTQFPEAANIFDNLHMLHDNVDDVLASPERYPTLQARRRAILRIHQVYLHRNHHPVHLFPEYHAKHEGMQEGGGKREGGHEGHAADAPGKHEEHDQAKRPDRPPSAREVFSRIHEPVQKPEPGPGPEPAEGGHKNHQPAGHGGHGGG